MSDSSITKHALADSLKELMSHKPLQKISITDICNHCQMNRKSFYYHFQDKYDLVNWIFDSEFLAVTKSQLYTDRWDFLNEMFHYFYKNHTFYHGALEYKGQNSLDHHFRELLRPSVTTALKNVAGSKEIPSFYIDFYSDALLCAVERWLTEKEPIPPDEFSHMLYTCIHLLGMVAPD